MTVPDAMIDDTALEVAEVCRRHDGILIIGYVGSGTHETAIWLSPETVQIVRNELKEPKWPWEP